MNYLKRNKDIFLDPNDSENKQYRMSMQLINGFNDIIIQKYIDLLGSMKEKHSKDPNESYIYLVIGALITRSVEQLSAIDILMKDYNLTPVWEILRSFYETCLNIRCLLHEWQV